MLSWDGRGEKSLDARGRCGPHVSAVADLDCRRNAVVAGRCLCGGRYDILTRLELFDSAMHHSTSQRDVIGPSDAPISANSEIWRTFAVPYRHRLVFTDDAFGCDGDLIGGLFENEACGSVRAQFWVDEGVTRANPHLRGKIETWIESQRGRVESAGMFACAGGEIVKNDWAHIERMLAAMHETRLDRRSYIVVVGGGALLDAVGFAAATAHRGIRLIRFPTTTLAQADSGIGVKNAVNRFGKKNWLGTFAVPWAVVNDAALLTTLPQRLWIAGFSEAVKVSLLKSPEIFARLERDAASIVARDRIPSQAAIRSSAELHLLHITEGGDPFELLEARPLDFGHWSAHRLEAMTGFELGHGEAVSVGIALDTVYSWKKFGFAHAERVLEAMRRLQLPRYHPMLEDDAVFTGLEEFREHLGGKLTVTMLRDIGRPFEVHEIDYQSMRASIGVLREEACAEGRADDRGS